MNNDKLEILDQRKVLEKDFKIYGNIDNPLFLAKDVAEWIDYAYKDKTKGTRNVNMMLKMLDEEDIIKAKIEGNNLATQVKHGGLRENTEFLFITEDGLYEVLMQSRKPIAKAFKKEVKKILKTIRKTGGYVSNEDMFINTYLPFADNTTRELFKSTLNVVRNQNEIITKQRKEIERKEDVIIGLVDDISLAEKRQVINRVVRKTRKNYSYRWNELYTEFEMKYHIDLGRRIENYNKNHKPKIKSKIDYIDKVLNKIPELYEITCKLYENDVDELVQEIYALNEAN